MSTTVQRFSFEDQDLTTIEYKGQPAWIASEVGKLLGYAGGGSRLQRSIGGEWKEEFIEGHDFYTLEGAELRALKDALELYPDFGQSFKYTPSLTIITESGLHLVCLKTNQPVGIRLRRWLVDEVLPQLARSGSYAPTSPALPVPTTSTELTTFQHNLQAELLAVESRLLGAVAELRQTVVHVDRTVGEMAHTHNLVLRESRIATQDARDAATELARLMLESDRTVSQDLDGLADRIAIRLLPAAPDQSAPLVLSAQHFAKLQQRMDHHVQARRSVGGLLGGMFTGDVVVGVRCPRCGAMTVWWSVRPVNTAAAACGDREGCGWWGSLMTLVQASGVWTMPAGVELPVAAAPKPVAPLPPKKADPIGSHRDCRVRYELLHRPAVAALKGVRRDVFHALLEAGAHLHTRHLSMQALRYRTRRSDGAIRKAISYLEEVGMVVVVRPAGVPGVPRANAFWVVR